MFTLRVPFRIAEGKRLGKLDELPHEEVEGLRLQLESSSSYYALTIEGFASLEEAEAFLTRSFGGLFWAMLNLSLPFSANTAFQEVHYPDDPSQAGANIFGPESDIVIEGMLDGSRPAVYRSGLSVSVMTAGEPSIEVGISAPEVLTAIVEGVRHADPNALEDTRVRTSLELFRSHFFERSPEARLLSLVMALEVLTTSQQKHPAALELIDCWKGQLVKLRGDMAEESEAAEALNALERELLFRRNLSLRSQIRILVKEGLKGPDTEDRARRAVEVYDARSKLVHTGRLDRDKLADALHHARVLVSAVLRTRLDGVWGQESGRDYGEDPE